MLAGTMQHRRRQHQAVYCLVPVCLAAAPAVFLMGCTLKNGFDFVARCVALAVPDYLPEITRWPGIQSIARLEAIREAHGKRISEVRYLIGSMAPDARAILTATRLHWGIENGLHRCLDVAFREDASAVHLRQAAANLGVLRKLAMNLFRLDTNNSKLSLPRKRKKAAWQPDYLFDLLDLQPLQ